MHTLTLVGEAVTLESEPDHGVIMRLRSLSFACATALLMLMAAGPAAAQIPAPAMPVATSEASAAPGTAPPGHISGGDAPGPVRPVAYPPLDPSTLDSALLEEMPYSKALEMAKSGQISEVLVRSTGRGLPVLYLRDARGVVWRSVLPMQRLDDDFMASGAVVRADNGGRFTTAAAVLGDVMSVAMSILILIVFANMARQAMGSRGKSGTKAAKIDRVTFADVAGQDAAKGELQEVVEFLRDPERYRAIGARIPQGVLLLGEPGNGKTLLAKAIAGEAGVNFIHLDGPEVLEMFAGLGARRIRATFAQCRKRSPCILFIDEIDSIGGKRGNGGGDGATSEREQILNQLLVEMNGIGKKGEVVVIGATNRPDMLDQALTRAGRLDRHIVVGRPDLAGREAILRVHARKVRLSPEVDLREVARSITGASGADTAHLVNEAAITAVRHQKPVVDAACFLEARDRQLLGAARPRDIMSPQERATAAYHEAGHALAAFRARHSDPVSKVSIAPRGRALGVVVRQPERDAVFTHRAKMLDDLVVAMAGRAAEELIFGRDMITTGAESDLQMATSLARMMAGRWGMSETIGHLTCLGSDGQPLVSQAMLGRLDEATRLLVDQAYLQASHLMQRERRALQALAETLLDVETMTGDEAKAVTDAALAGILDAVAA